MQISSFELLHSTTFMHTYLRSRPSSQMFMRHK
jgi:hypothetical protein